MTRIVALVLGFLAVFALLSGCFEFGRAHADGSGSAVAAEAGSAAPAATPTPQPSDVGVMTKLYKSGSFFALGIMAVFLGLSVASKLDKKHAFYIATGLGGLALLVESIRKGDTPNATSVVEMLTTTVGIMIAGPGHVKAPAA